MKESINSLKESEMDIFESWLSKKPELNRTVSGNQELKAIAREIFETLFHDMTREPLHANLLRKEAESSNCHSFYRCLF